LLACLDCKHRNATLLTIVEIINLIYFFTRCSVFKGQFLSLSINIIYSPSEANFYILSHRQCFRQDFF